MAEHLAQDIVQELLRQMEPIRASMQAKRAEGMPLAPAEQAALVEAYVATMRSRGWFKTTAPEQLDEVLEVLVLRGEDGSAELDVESNVTGSVLSVPGWGVTETDAAAVGRGIAEDEADLLDDARENGELTGWE